VIARERTNDRETLSEPTHRLAPWLRVLLP